MKGSRNKATIERETKAAIEAQRAMAQSKTSGRKLGKDILDDFANVFASMAAHYQPTPAGSLRQNLNQDEEKFKEYAKLAIDAADKAADFFSPRFKAIAVAIAPAQIELARPEGENVIDMTDPHRIQRVYQSMLKARRAS